MVPTGLEQVPWTFALRISRLYRDVWCKLRRVASLTLRRSWLKVLVYTCTHFLSFSGMIHHGGRKVVACWPVASEISGMMGLRAYVSQNGGFQLVSQWRL